MARLGPASSGHNFYVQAGVVQDAIASSTVVVEADGNSAGLSGASADASAVWVGLGAATGLGTPTANAVALWNGLGAATDVGTATGTAAAIWDGVGAATGLAIEADASVAIWDAVGASSGVGTATGLSGLVASSVGLAEGVATCTGIGEAGTSGSTTAGYSQPKKKRYYAEIGGMRFLFPSEQARQRAVEAENPKEVVAQVIKKAAVRKAEPVKQAEIAEPVPEWDDEEDIEMLLMAL